MSESTNNLPGNGSFYDPFNKKKQPYNPFQIFDVDPSVKALQKSTEERMYIVLYYNLEYEEYKFKKFYGRYNAYFGIRDILEAESIDLRISEVLVETVGIDPKSKKATRYLSHPENAVNIIDFCHLMEQYFGDNSYSIEEYDTGVSHEEDESEAQFSSKEMTNSEVLEATMPKTKDTNALKEALDGILGIEDAIAADGAMHGLTREQSLPYGSVRDVFNSHGIDIDKLYMSSEQAKEVGAKVFIPSTLSDVEGKEI